MGRSKHRSSSCRWVFSADSRRPIEEGVGMEEAIARAELVALPDATASSAVKLAIPRRDVETALAAEDGPMDLVLDVAWMENPDDAQPAELRKIAISWERDQLEHLLLKADGDVVTVVFDQEGLVRLVDPDFELHGLRTGIAILAVAVAAGATSGVAFGAQVDEGASGGNAAAYTAIEQSRGAVVTPDPSGVIEAVRSVAANPGPAGAASRSSRRPPAARPRRPAASKPSAQRSRWRPIQASRQAGASRRHGQPSRSARSAAPPPLLPPARSRQHGRQSRSRRRPGPRVSRAPGASRRFAPPRSPRRAAGPWRTTASRSRCQARRRSPSSAA